MGVLERRALLFWSMIGAPDFLGSSPIQSLWESKERGAAVSNMNPASPKKYYTTIAPSILVHEVMHD